MRKVLGLGDCVVDKYIHTQVMYPGGNALNFSVYASMLGVPSAYLGVFGDDAAAALIQRSLDRHGVDRSRCRHEAGANGYSSVNLVDGDRVFIKGNNGGAARLHPIRLDEEDLAYMRGFDIVHTSCYSFIEPEMEKLRAGGAVTFDFSNEFDDAYLAQICPHIDLALLSCGGREEPEIHALAADIQGRGCKYVLASMGERGAMFFTGGKSYRQTPKRTRVKDTLGAGDALFTAFALHFFPGNREDEAHIRASLSRAADFAAEICALDGAFGCGEAY